MRRNPVTKGSNVAKMNGFSPWGYWGLVALLLLGPWIVGCGSGDARRYHISGTVTFQGQPVPAGTISFDAEEGTTTGGGFAPIVEGRFDTAADGRGHLGGSQVVRIRGESAPPSNLEGIEADSFVAKELFPPYETTVDLPRRRTTKDFEVP